MFRDCNQLINLDLETIIQYFCNPSVESKRYLQKKIDEQECAIFFFDENYEMHLYNEMATHLFSITSSDNQSAWMNNTKLKVLKEILLYHSDGIYSIENGNNSMAVFSREIASDDQNWGTVIIINPMKEVFHTVEDKRHDLVSVADLYAAFNASFDGVFIVNDKGFFVQCNNSFERILDIKRELFLGEHITKLYRIINPDYLKEIENKQYPPVLKTLKNKSIETITVKVNNRNVLVTTSPVLNENDEITAVIGNVRDITDVEVLKEELTKQTDITKKYSKELASLKQLQFEHIDAVVKSKAMVDVMEKAQMVGEFDTNVLILGESGTGKEVVSKFIHKNSNRSKEPFIRVNCGAIPDGLFESEMFGYVEGAFTGAKANGKKGYFEMANQGTIFLDEISELNYDMQVKLLRVLQESEVQPVGSEETVRIDIRVLAASNKDLEQLVQQQLFRADLYYRLNVVSLNIPALRDRKEDIIPLMNHFISKLNDRYKRKKYFSNDVYTLLTNYEWPGNIRQLENLMENLMVLVQEDEIKIDNLPKVFFQIESNFSKVKVEGVLPLKKAVELAESEVINNASKLYGSTKEIAKALGVDQSTVLRKMKAYLHR